MSAEVYLGCEHCKEAFHVGYIVTIRSNFVFDPDMAQKLSPLEKWITKHSYCGGSIRYPRLMWEPSVDEDTWKVTS